MEEQVLDCCKLISYCIVIGDGQRYITALVSLRCEVSHMTTQSHTHTHTHISHPPRPLMHSLTDSCSLSLSLSLSDQLSPEGQPLDQMDALGLSVAQELGSTATTGTPLHVYNVYSLCALYV